MIQNQTRSSSDGALLQIETGRLYVTDGGVIESSTVSGASGDAGAISIDADEVVVSRTSPSETPGFIATASQAGSLGNGGDIGIDTNTLRLENGGQISTTAAGRNAGNLQVDADADVILIGDDGGLNPSGLFSRALASSNGTSGAITVEAARIRVEDGATISAISSSVGGSGSILLDQGSRCQAFHRVWLANE